MKVHWRGMSACCGFAEATCWLEAVQATGFADEHPPPQTKPPPHPSPPLLFLYSSSHPRMTQPRPCLLPNAGKAAAAAAATRKQFGPLSSLCQLLASRCGNDRRRRLFLCRFVQNGQKCGEEKSREERLSAGDVKREEKMQVEERNSQWQRRRHPQIIRT